jgi:hypothetical protein
MAIIKYDQTIYVTATSVKVLGTRSTKTHNTLTENSNRYQIKVYGAS